MRYSGNPEPVVPVERMNFPKTLKNSMKENKTNQAAHAEVIVDG
jgi:hypothetical protein